MSTTPNALAQYKVCYAGWDNNPNSYSVNSTNAYGVHHPKGDTKKISYVDTVYPVMSNEPMIQSGLFGYYGIAHQLNSQGTFLQNSWRSGIVEKGSSGSPLFNSFDRLIGSLSTGPKPNYFNCDNPDIYNNKWFTYYSRFSNNYFTMSPWLNPNGSNVQSIGPYCPNNSIQIGAPISITNPGTGNPEPTVWEDVPIDINGEVVHPANTWGKKLYLNEYSGSANYPQEIDMNFNYYRSIIAPNKSTFAISENIYNIYNYNINNYLSNLQLWGIYKIIDCNKIKYIKPAKITIQNPGTIGQVSDYVIDVVGVSDNRVHILIEEWRKNGNGTYKTYEIQTYKIINNELVFESYKTLFYNQQNINMGKYYDFDNGHLMLSVGQNSGNSSKIYSCYYNEQNGNWLMDTNPITYGVSNVFTKIVGNKVFIQPLGQNKIDIYNIASNLPTLGLRGSLSNQFLSVPGGNGSYDRLFISERSNNLYDIIYKNMNGIGSFELMQLDLSNNSINSSHITMPNDFKNIQYSSNFIIKNDEIIKLSKFPWRSSPGSEYGNYGYANFKKNVNGNWMKDKITFLKWNDIGGFNDQFIISADYYHYYGNNTRRRIFSIREVDYLAHPYTIYDEMVMYSSAYHRPKKLDNYYFSEGIVVNGKEVFKNLAGTSLNKFLFRSLNLGNDYNSTTYDVKTVILDNKTQQLTGNKNVFIYGKYSVIMKSGFHVSSATGIEFHAIAQQPLPSNIPECSLTFDDMLNPKITETPNNSLYLRQAVIKDQPYYGEITINGGEENSNVENTINKNIKVYPNPTKDILYVDFNGNVKDFNSLEIYSVDAKKVITKSLSSANKGKIEVNLSQYPTGIYILKVIDKDGKSYPYKIIKK
ncbi:hypothetical protein IQ37_19645 [Chryseobacterium piperi]|uniref:Secretion system C-terminal sorting domain-containing protein n=1 Tax=Chryseobacterium piperi TaxID=558152 RepID=A0A086A195_9FLAO|nr:T9SS type A sorting domain-containing protein [Chryseobacterium piperi]ASW74787.1 T9SS C-terminal target domain-containing protein [Chryseobacterium piperi]KFF10459.1 hypothetical protein IQ37_19645 [Chryseobacterium piperi]